MRLNNQLDQQPMSKKRILVVDDHAIVRQGLIKIVNTEENLEICGEAASVSEALMMIEKLEPHIIITDLSLPDRGGIELILDSLAIHPHLKILVFSFHDESLYAERVIRAGAKGYVMKGGTLDELQLALKVVTNGDIYVSQNLASQMLRVFSCSKENDSGHSILNTLTDRELQVYELIGQGCTNQEIAERLGITARTTDAHKTKIKNKLGIAGNNSLFRHAILWVESNNT